MKVKVIMNSGKEYVVENERYSVQGFINSFYNENKIPGGQTINVMKNGFMYLDEEQTISFNPSHVSSVEVVDKE